MTRALNIEQEFQRARRSVIDKLETVRATQEPSQMAPRVARDEAWPHDGNDHHSDAGRHG